MEKHRDWEYITGGASFMERYSDADIQLFLKLGIAKRFMLPEGVADDAVVSATNKENEDRVDITFWDGLAGVPIRGHILIDISEGGVYCGVPYCWAFTLNLTKAKDKKIKIDVGKVKEVANEIFPQGRVIFSVENFPHYSENGNFSHSDQKWDNNDLLMINILNVPPVDVLRFIWRVGGECITEAKDGDKFYNRVSEEIDDILNRKQF